MSDNSASIVSKVWNYAHVLKNAGVGYGDYVEQITYHPGAFAKRKETERFKKFTYAEIVARDKANLDILWLKDDSLEDSENLPAPALLAAEIVESLEAALEEFRAVEEALVQNAD
jgi:type I restriction enzyme M protein